MLMADPLASSGVAQIQQLIAKWRDMHSMADYDGNNYPEGFYRAEDYANELDELITALLAVDAPQHQETKEDLTRVDKGIGSRTTGSTASEREVS